MIAEVLSGRPRRGGWTRVVSGVAAGAVALGSLGAGGAGAMAQPAKDTQPAKAEKKSTATPVLLIERASLEKMVVDPRDAALAKAVAMLPARIRELPGEIPEFGKVPPPVIDLALALIASPERLAITFNNDDQLGGAFGVGLIASMLTGGQDQAQAMHGTINALVAMSGAGEQFPTEPSKKYATMSEINGIPVGKLIRFGPRQAADGWRYEIHAGSAGDPDATFAALPTAARSGFEPVLRARLDLAALTPLVEQFRAMAAGDPQADQGFDAIEKAGLVGASAVKFSYQFGYTADRSLGISVTEGAKKHAATLGISTTPLAAEDFKSIPADSYMAGLRRVDLSSFQTMIEGVRASQAEIADGLAKFQQATGVDIVTDVLGSLGGTVGWYMADSTGGLGLLSTVALVQFKDRAKFDAASAKLTSFANTALSGPTKGYVRARSWNEGDAKMVSITFPGLPVPLELTYTTTDRFLILAASPQAAVAAARQAMGKGDGGLMANAAFAAGLPKGKEFESVGFTDTPRTMAFGYQFVSLFGSAIANVARSPRDPSREPGLVVPTLGELKKDARARVAFGYWDGDNLVRETHGNRSMLVETCGAAGAASPFIPVIVAAVAAAGVSAQQAQREAQQQFIREFAAPEGMEEEVVVEEPAPKPAPKRTSQPGVKQPRNN